MRVVADAEELADVGQNEEAFQDVQHQVHHRLVIDELVGRTANGFSDPRLHEIEQQLAWRLRDTANPTLLGHHCEEIENVDDLTELLVPLVLVHRVHLHDDRDKPQDDVGLEEHASHRFQVNENGQIIANGQDGGIDVGSNENRDGHVDVVAGERDFYVFGLH